MRRRTRGRRSGHAGGRLPLIAIDADGSLPLYEQIYRDLREQIVGGQLRAGVRLASTRTLAAELGISRFTVVSAVERLLAEGYLVTRRGSGTFVVDMLPERRMRPARPTSKARVAGGDSKAPALSARGTALSAVVITGPRLETNEPRPFRPRRPALDVFPIRLWARLVRRQWQTYRHQHLDYGEPAGYRPLREAIAEHIGVARGVRCEPQQVIVTSGAQQAFDLLFKLLVDPGDKVWIEDPGYLDVRAALIGSGADVIAVPVDESGIDVAEGIRRAADARLVVVSPSHQYPTGATLSATRRTALLEWARPAGAWVVEDDYDSYFRYRGRPIPALQRFDEEGVTRHRFAPRVLYVGTFSKTMFPSLRLGFCIVPLSLVDAVANARAIADRNSPIADQAALASFIADGHYDRHLRRAQLVYQERYEAMQFYFERALGGVVALAPATAGTHLIGWLHDREWPQRGSESVAVRVSREAAVEDLVVFPLSRYALEPPDRDGLILGYGGVTPRRIARGVERLARAIDRVRLNRR
jgi:GntR family transcriptional regulator/MocR family aminotransferase